MDNNQQSFWQFSDQLRVQTSNLANLSLNDSIWSNNYSSKRPGERRNFDIKVGGDINYSSLPPAAAAANNNNYLNSKAPVSDFNNDGWKPMNNNYLNSKAPVSDFNNDGWKPMNNNNLKSKAPISDFNNDGWKPMNNNNNNINGSPFTMPYNNNNNSSNLLGVGMGFDNGVPLNLNLNGGFNKGIYSKPSYGNLNNNNFNINLKGLKGKGEDDLFHQPKGSKKNNNNNKKHGDNNNDNNKDAKAATDKRFKTLPPSEALPRDETIGGYIFVCNNDTMAENLKRQLFGLPPRYRDSVRAITPGLPLFLYNYSTHQLHGIFEAASFGGSNIDPTAWEDKKCPGESRFPAQVQVITRKTCEPLEEDSFRPILHHYDGPKFRLELNVPEALSLLDIFAEQDTFKNTFKVVTE